MHSPKTIVWMIGCVLFMPISAAGVDKLNVVLVSGAKIYQTEVSLPKYKEYLETHFPVECTLLHTEDKEELKGLEALEDCDVALFYTRRMQIEGEALDRVKSYLTSGKPIVALRTASHGFQGFLEFDKEILGGNYDGHFKKGIPMEIHVTNEGKNHPVLQGVGEIDSVSSLYRTGPLAEDTSLLMEGRTPDSTQPLVWTRVNQGGRLLYAALGSVQDFEQESFRRMVTNAIFWTAEREVPRPK